MEEEDETPTEAPAPQAEDEDGSILNALVKLERQELQRYCQDITVDGAIAQTVTLTLRKGNSLWVSRGCLLAYTEGIEWTLKVPGGATKAVGRMLSGEGLSLIFIECVADGGQVVLTANQPGKLVTWDLDRGPITCTSGAFVAALGEVDISVTMARSVGGALFGGAGLLMQQLSGTGIVIVHGSGDFLEHRLDHGQKLLVSTGNLAVFSSNVGYGVRSVGGCRKMLWGGEGLFMTELTGPGWVMLQSLKKVPQGPKNQQ